ncbi:hypothetical protein [uncultured Tenacibaculum sp.]|uniref:hypothetical protein n=1 Tax=uncultured Tenacibaculum sp. TaxID=174713 RepID=UPI00261E78BB|nr:hypothetical protein [uncultured Tenacibaculum sp.]
MKIFKYILLFILPFTVYTQNEKPTKAIDGVYHLLERERTIGNKQTKTKFFQYSLLGTTKVVAVAACKKCIPAIYKYQEAESKELNRPVFYNNIGLFLISYDQESFVMVMPANKQGSDWTDFAYSNFYSKNSSKVASMSQKKIKDFILQIAN